MNITAAREDYIRAILYLAEKSNGPVKAGDVARYLKLSKSTVSERLHELAEQKLIVHPQYARVRLTPRGRRIARNLTHKHRIIEVFLHRTLNMPRRAVHKEAHRLEHAFSDTVIKKLGTFLHNPRRDPHGMPIPTMK